MKTIFGILTVFICVIGGFILANGNLLALWQPVEILIILGAAGGSFIISNPWYIIKNVSIRIVRLFIGANHSKKPYLDLLKLLHNIGVKIRKNGLLSVETDIEYPHKSKLLMNYRHIFRNRRLLVFLTDNLRFILGGQFSSHELESLIDHEIETIEEYFRKHVEAVSSVSESLPGFGIIAAVLGIVITMQFIGGDPKILGIKVAAALVGTFLGILLSYGLIGPLGSAMRHQISHELLQYQCVKTFLVAFVSGNNPAISAEFARQSLSDHVKPSFSELDNILRTKPG